MPPLPSRHTLPAALCVVGITVAGCSDQEPVGVASDHASTTHASATTAPSAATGVGDVESVLSLDIDEGELPEGIAFDKRGNMFVTLAPLAQVLRVAPDGSSSVFATLTTTALDGAPGALGLATDAPGNVYAALVSFDPDTHGVHRIGRDGQAGRIEGTEDMILPNGLAFDARGALYITDSATGSIWRAPRGGAAQLWIQHEDLEGTGAFGIGVPIGANGIAYDKGILYVVNSEKGLVVAVPVRRDGSAGAPTVLVDEPTGLLGLDGVQMDVHGRLYATLNVQNRIVRIDLRSGEVTELAAGDGLDFPASLAFGTTRNLQQTVFITNFALFDDPEDPTPPGPGVVRLDVGAVGRPLP